MSQPIKKDELVESGVLDNLIQPLIQVQEELKKTDAMIVSFADAVASKLNFGEKAKEMREFVQVEQDLSKVYEQKKETQKEAIKNDNEIEKLKRKIAEVTREEAKEVAALKAELQAQNKELRDSAKAAKDGTEAYKALEKEVTKAKNESKNLGAELLALKKAGQENTAEYQALAQTYADSTAKAAQLDKELKTLDKSVGDNQRNVGNYASAFAELDAKVAEGGMTMREMSKAIKEYQTIAVNAGMETPIGQEALAKAGELKDRISDVSAVTKALSTDTINLDAAKNTVTGLAGGYQAVQGAMVLVGSENQDMMKAMAKLTAIQSIMNGLKSFEAMINKNNIALLKQTTLFVKGQTAAKAAYTFVTKGATLATVALRAAMIALPIVAIVAGIAALVYKFGSWNKESGKATEQQKRLDEATRKETKAIVEQTGKFVGLVHQLKATNAGSKEREKLMKQINTEYGTTLTNISDEEAFQKQLNQAVAEYIVLQRNKIRLQREEKKFQIVLEDQLRYIERRDELQRELNKLDKTAEQQTKDNTKSIKDQIFEQNGLNKAQEDGNEIGLNALINDTKVASKKGELTIKIERLNRQISIMERGLMAGGMTMQEIQAEIDGLIKKSDKLTRSTVASTKATKEKNDQDKRFASERMAEIERVFNAEDEFKNGILSNEQKQIKAVEEKYTELIRIAKAYGYDTATLERAQQAEIDKIEQEAHEERKKANFERRKQELELLNKQREAQNLAEAKNKEDFDEWEKQRQIDHLEKMLELEKEYGEETIDTQIASARLRQDLRDKETKDLSKSAENIANATMKIYDNAADRAIEAMRRQQDAAANMFNYFAQAAAQGNIQASQSMAEMIERQDQLQRRQELIERRKLRMQRATQASTILLKSLEGGKSVPEALAAMGAFLAASDALIPSFYDGTENTGKGGKIDAKGGFAAILHPNERVMTASQNAKIGDIPNPVVADVMYNYRMGKLDGAGNSYDLMVLKNELSEIKKAIQDQPQQVVGLEETLSGIVKLTVQTKKGNHTNTHKMYS